jgi:hypothetical protein
MSHDGGRIPTFHVVGATPNRQPLGLEYVKTLVGSWVRVEGDDRRFFLLKVDGDVATLSRTRNGPRCGVTRVYSIRPESSPTTGQP